MWHPRVGDRVLDVDFVEIVVREGFDFGFERLLLFKPVDRCVGFAGSLSRWNCAERTDQSRLSLLALLALIGRCEACDGGGKDI